MKITRNLTLSLFLIFAALTPVYSSDSQLDGGPARLLAMGNQEICVEDNATIIDPVNMGFSAGIFTRPAQSVISLYPGLYLMTQKSSYTDASTYNATYYGAGNDASGNANNGLGMDSELDLRMNLGAATLGLKGIFIFVNLDTPQNGGKRTYFPEKAWQARISEAGVS